MQKTPTKNMFSFGMFGGLNNKFAPSEASTNVTPRDNTPGATTVYSSSRDITPKNNILLPRMPQHSPTQFDANNEVDIVSYHTKHELQSSAEEVADSYFPKLKRRRAEDDHCWNRINFDDALDSSRPFRDLEKGLKRTTSDVDMENNNDNENKEKGQHQTTDAMQTAGANKTPPVSQVADASEKMDVVKDEQEDELPMGCASPTQHALVMQLRECAEKSGLRVSVSFHAEGATPLNRSTKTTPRSTPRTQTPVRGASRPSGCAPFVSSKSKKNASANASRNTTPSTRASSSTSEVETFDPLTLPPAHGDNSLREGWRHLNRPLHEPVNKISLYDTRAKKMGNNLVPMRHECLLDELPPETLSRALGETLAENGTEGKISWYTNLMRKDSRYCPFFSQTVPGIAPAAYCNRLRTHFSSTGNCFLAAIIYLDRLGAQAINPHTIHRLFLTALVLGTKYVESDCYYENVHYAKCGGVSRVEMNELEMIFLDFLKWDMYISEADFAKYRKMFHS